MPTSNVSIRLSLQDAEAVRAGLEKLGSDGAAALKKLEAASAHPSQGLSAIDKTAADLKGRLEDTARSIGPLGTLLLGLGPIGLTVAAGIGAAVAIVYEMSKAASELGSRAMQIRNFAEETGLTATAIQALTSEGAKFGLAGEQMAQGLQRLSVNLDQAHRGTGALYQDLYRINPELAHQVAGARDVAAAYDLIGKAIKQATDAGNTTQANTIARAAFGRNPGGQGALAADVSSQGGVNSLAATYQSAGKAIDSGLIDRLAKLKTEIDDTDQRAKDAWASIFSEDVLDRSLRMSQAWERMAKAAAEMKDASWGDWFTHMAVALHGDVELAPADEGAARYAAEQDAMRAAAQAKLNAGLAAGKNSDSELNSFWQPAGRAKPETAVATVAQTAKEVAGNVYTAYEDAKKLMSLLGSAATPAEQRALELKKLNAERDENKKVPGASAALDRQQADFDQNMAAAATSARERLGIASQEEITTAALVKLRKDYADGYVKEGAEMEQAEARVAKAAEQTYKQMQVQNAAFKGLKQFELDSKDVNASLDKLGTSTLGNLNTALVDMEMNTRRSADTWRTFGLSAIKSVEDIINKMLILGPLSKLMQPGGFGAVQSGGLGALFGFAGGGIMGPGGPLSLRRYAGGGIANSPQLAMFGEGSRPEAYVPLPDGRAIPVRLNGGGGGGGHTVNTTLVQHINVPSGTSPDDARQMAASFARESSAMVRRIVDERIVTHLRVGGVLNPA